MKKVRMLIVAVMMCGLALFANGSNEKGTTAPASGAKYPTKPITLICGWAPGGSSDLQCRKVAELSKKYLGVEMNVVNMTGGNGVVSLTNVAANTKADGYTIALATNSLFCLQPYTTQTGYQPEQFTVLTGTTAEPLALVVRKDSPLKNLKDVVDQFKKTGMPITHAQGGKNGAVHIMSLLVFDALGVDQQIMSYGGASEAITAMLGKEVDMAIVHPGQALGQVQGGEARIIAVIYRDRLPDFPDAPTVKEQGYGDISSEVDKFFVIHSDTDPSIIAYLRDGLNKLMEDPEYIAFLKTIVAERNIYRGDEDSKALFKAQVNDFWPILTDLGLLRQGAVKPE